MLSQLHMQYHYIQFKLQRGSFSKCYLNKDTEQKSITAVMLGALQTQPLISVLVQRDS